MRNTSLVLKTTLLYLCFGIVWIYFSDALLFNVFFEEDSETYIKAQRYKGFFYVIITSLLLFLLLYNYTKKINASENRIKKATRIGKIGYWSYNTNQKEFEFSAEFRDMINNEIGKKVLLEQFLKIIHPDDKEYTHLLFNRLTVDEKLSIKFRLLLKNDRVICMHFIGDGKYKKNGILEFTGSAQDVTDEERLRNLLKSAYDLAKIGTWELKIKDNVIFWSEMTRKIHEVDDDYVPNLDEAINFYKSGHNRELLKDTIDKSYENGGTWDLELEFITAKGNTIWVRTIGQTELDSNGNPLRLFGTVQDITERKLNEIDLNIFKEIVSNTMDGVAIADNIGRVTFMNSSMIEKIGFTPNEIEDSGGAIKLFKDKELGEQIINKLLKGNHWSGELELITKSGELVNYFLSAGALFNTNIELVGIFGIFTDITYRIQAQNTLVELNDNLQKSLKELKAVNEELEQFAFVASHDLQEPLRMVTSFLNMLSKKYNEQLDEKGQKYIYFATEGADRMRQIILDLLEYSRAGKLESKKEHVDLNVALDDYKILRRKIIEEKEVTITTLDLDVVKWYKAPLVQTIHALLDNAIKYTSPDKKPIIKVQLSQQKEEWEISISDNGIGIKEDYFESIFIMFKRLHNRENYEGSGLGLALVKKNVESWGGRISVKSKVDEGSTFTFTVPKN